VGRAQPERAAAHPPLPKQPQPERSRPDRAGSQRTGRLPPLADTG
jgi:hypothetical protein